MHRIRQAASVKDPPLKEKQLTAARADLEEARGRFVDATARYFEQYTQRKAALGADASKRPKPAAPMSKKQRQAEEALRDAEIAWLECRFKSAKIDFYCGADLSG